MNTKTCIIITGPTSSGKTQVAIELAKFYDTAIISADSRQCYRELNIGVAKPRKEQLESIKHYFVDTHSVQEEITAAGFERYALETAEQLFRDKDVIIMAGGTGLYIDAFAKGLDNIPAIPAETRNLVVDNTNLYGIAWLQGQLETLDKDFFQTGDMQNPRRMMRALEVMMTTGKSITTFQLNNKAERDFETIYLAIDTARPQLYEQINNRVDEMMGEGLLEEVKSLLPYRHLNALQTVGYREMFLYLDGEITLPHAVDLIKQHTRNYAKRQITWFRKNPEILWCPLENIVDMATSHLDR